MNIKLCTFVTDTTKKDVKFVLKVIKPSEFKSLNKSERNFIEFIRLLEINPYWEKQIYKIRKNCNIPKNGLGASSFTAIMHMDPSAIKRLIGEKNEKKLNQSTKKLLKKFKLGENKELRIYWFIAFNLFLTPMFDEMFNKLFIHWSKSSDKFFPNYAFGGVTILIQNKFSKTEFIKLINKKWPIINEKMKKIKREEYSLPKFHDLDLMIAIYQLKKSGKKYTEIRDELEKDNIFLEKDTLRQKFKALNDYFKREK